MNSSSGSEPQSPPRPPTSHPQSQPVQFAQPVVLPPARLPAQDSAIAPTDTLSAVESAYFDAVDNRDAGLALSILQHVSTSHVPISPPDPSVNIRNSNGIAPLFSAAAAGDEPRLRRLLLKGADPNAAADDTNWSPLHIAAMNGHTEPAMLLLRFGADPNSRTDSGDTPLHAAAFTGDAPLLRALLTHGADPNAANIEGGTALGCCLFRGGGSALASVEALLAAGADPNSQRDTALGPPLHLATTRGHLDAVRALLRARADPCSATGRLSVCAGITPLQRAVMLGHGEVALALLAAGAGRSVDAADEDGDTALRHACFRGRGALVWALLAAGANPMGGTRRDVSKGSTRRSSGTDGPVPEGGQQQEQAQAGAAAAVEEAAPERVTSESPSSDGSSGRSAVGVSTVLHACLQAGRINGGENTAEVLRAVLTAARSKTDKEAALERDRAEVGPRSADNERHSDSTATNTRSTGPGLRLGGGKGAGMSMGRARSRFPIPSGAGTARTGSVAAAEREWGAVSPTTDTIKSPRAHIQMQGSSRDEGAARTGASGRERMEDEKEDRAY